MFWCSREVDKVTERNRQIGRQAGRQSQSGRHTKRNGEKREVWNEEREKCKELHTRRGLE